jgi:hypothetical protein
LAYGVRSEKETCGSSNEKKICWSCAVGLCTLQVLIISYWHLTSSVFVLLPFLWKKRINKFLHKCLREYHVCAFLRQQRRTYKAFFTHLVHCIHKTISSLMP